MMRIECRHRSHCSARDGDFCWIGVFFDVEIPFANVLCCSDFCSSWIPLIRFLHGLSFL